MQDTYDAIIIGGGMGGLTCGAWLAHKGLRVLVLEQNIRPGGLCTSYRRGAFNFTPAASIMTGFTKENGFFERLVKSLGIDNDIEFIPLEQGYHVHFPDLDYLMFSGGGDARERFIEQLVGMFPHERSGINSFFSTLVKLYRQSEYATFLGTAPGDIARILCKCPSLVKHMGKNIVQFMNDHVSDPRLKAVLSINSTCANLPPSRMSLLGIAGLLIEGGLSNPHVKGGPQAVSEAFAKSITAAGGDILLGHMADAILVENNRALGVTALPSPLAMEEEAAGASHERREFRARHIVSAIDARQTFGTLVGADKLPAKFMRMLGGLEPTPPFCALFLGLDIDLKERGLVPALHIHSSTYDTEEHFRNVAAKLEADNGPDPFFRFQLGPLSDPASAPKGKTAFVMHHIPVPSRGWGNSQWEQRFADRMIKRAEKIIPGLSSHIEYREFLSPATIDRYTLCGTDSSIGWALTPQQVGPKRLSQITPVENLLLSGHWTEPALGVLATVISGLKAATTILKREGTVEPLAEIGIRNGVPE